MSSSALYRITCAILLAVTVLATIAIASLEMQGRRENAEIARLRHG